MIEHTADLAFLIRGYNFSELYLHGMLALAFSFPALLQFFSKKECATLAQVIQSLNQLVTKADIEMGCSFKAVSYAHGLKEVNGLYEWEMIVDV